MESIKHQTKKENENLQNKQHLIQTILNCTASRREARSYLAKYALLEANDIYKQSHQDIDDKVDNSLHTEPSKNNSVKVTHNKAYGDYVSRVVTNGDTQMEHSLKNFTNANDINEIKLTETIRSCIIKIDIDSLNNDWDGPKLKELGKILRTVLDLGASPILIVGFCNTNHPTEINAHHRSQINKIKTDLRNYLGSTVSLRILEGCFEINGKNVVAAVPSMIGVPVFSGMIPIIIPTAVDPTDLKTKMVSTAKVTKAVVNCIGHLNEKNKDSEDLMTVEKIVFVDNVGGIPSVERGGNSSHVLINLQQEFHSVIDELSPLSSNQSNRGKVDWLSEDLKADKLKSFKEMAMLLRSLPNSTGIMTTPSDLIKRVNSDNKEPNPLIYSILTDRATQSSSLPVGFGRTKEVHTSILKWGTPVHIVTANSLRALGLESCVKPDYPSCIDLEELERRHIISSAKLQHLLEDSFRRKLDWNHYMNRIKDNVAAIIFTTDYSACAIVTYEPLKPDAQKSETTLEDYSESWIPYLDKFAVLRAQQGEPGLADIVFKALLSQFSEELVWRSRKTNPVNKWYFERSVGTVGIDNSQWRVFFTGWKNEEWDDERVKGYIDACRDIEPSFIS